jgi:3-hydroxybutyryl-CoA dehydrogenase
MKKVAVIGAGTMGNGIAHVFAQNEFKVTLIDVSQDQLNKALQTITKNLDRQIAKGIIEGAVKESALQNIKLHVSLEAGVADADLIIEAASENTDLKFSIFRQIDEYAKINAILATNTSSISITKIASVTNRAGSVIGMHFMNPVPVMKLVEVINGYSTATEVTDRIVELSRQLGQVPCVVNDYPGFIANRILMPMINESIYSLFEGVAGVEDIDSIMKLGMAHPMGPLQLADFIGLDVCLSILNVLYEGFGNQKYSPCPLLVNMVAAKQLGVKTGEGFYNYQAGNKEAHVSRMFNKYF